MQSYSKEPSHILVVDDNAEIRNFLKGPVLEMNGSRVTVAVDGAEGLELATQLKPDLILLDYEMPRLNGIEVLYKLREREIKIPVILITSYGSESVAVEVFRLGVRDYVTKPFTTTGILNAIERVLQQVHVERERDDLLIKLQQVNDQLTKRINELDTLYHVSKSVTTLREREKLLERIIDAALYLTHARDGMLVLFDPKSGNLTTQVRRAKFGNQYHSPEQRIDITTGTLGLMMSVPLQVGGRVIGALRVSNKRKRKGLNQKDRQLLRMLGDYAAIAIENFRLLSEIEAQQEQEKREIRDLFEHYISPTVVERLLKHPQSVRPGGQRQIISILFADLRGFTTFTANSSPEALMAVLNRHMAAAAEVILEKQGTLDKFMGDEVMAFFNSPLSQENYALRAVEAGWQIIQATQRIHRQLPVQQRLEFGVGIATGEAIVGNIGTSQLVNYTAVGRTVNKGHTLQELAPAQKIWICRQTYELAREYIKARELPPINIKGQRHPEPVYEVTEIQKSADAITS